MKSILITSLLLLFSFTTLSQMSIKIDIRDTTDAINDAFASVKVDGGKAPYKYMWSKDTYSIYQDKIEGITEGELIKLTVVDANGLEAKDSAIVAAEGFQENMNSGMKPVVNVMQTLFFYPLYTIDTRIDDRYLNAPWANNPKLTNYIVKEWLVEDGATVKHQDPIAILSNKNGDITFFAVGDGKVKHLVKEGGNVFKDNKRGNRVPTAIVQMLYPTPQPLYKENGEESSSSIPLIVLWLVLGAIFFTVRMKFINVTGVKHAIQLVQGKFDDPNDKGEVSHFQALVTALSGTVGLGNIAGVAVAVSLGGPGATFWMIVAGLIGMASKFVECSLGVKYREIDEDGEVSGGPMYYLSRGLKKRGLAKLGKVLAIIFAILCVGGSFGGGNMFQANQAFEQLSGVPAFSGMAEYGWLFGLILSALVGIVIVGGIKKIASVTDKIVPLMVGIYVLSALIIIFLNITNIGEAFGMIFEGAFSPSAAYGGIIGVLILGFQRAAFSNEAGVGSASIAHSAAKTNEHVSEGTVALLEPFIDTVVVCTMTALVLIFTGYATDTEGLTGANLTSAAFSSSLGDWAHYVLAFAAVLFAFSTMISWSYYGLKAWTYVFGSSKAAETSYKVLFLGFVVLGSSVGLGAVLDFSDMMILGMAFPNILGLFIMSGEVRADMKDYFARVKSGAIQRFK